MPARAAWKGFLQIHQLQVPVKAFTATATQPEIVLHQLHADCGQRIRQLKTCPVHGELATESIVSGYECSDGCYLPLAAADLEALQPEDGKAITVDCFVKSAVVDPVFHSGRTYYLVPDGPPGQRPFGVLREGMRSGEQIAVSRVVMARRELLVLLRPMDRLIAMTVLEYPQRVRPAADYESEVAAVTPGEQEQALIRQLIDALSDPDFDLARYSNPYIDGLTKLIEQRLANANPVATSEQAPIGESPADEAELIAALRATLATAGADKIPTTGARRALSHLAEVARDSQPARKHA